MKRFLVCCGMFAGLVGLTNCTKNDVVTPDVESVDFTACIYDVDTKTALDGLKVNWVKDDKIGIQVSRNHTQNAATSKATYSSTYGVYRLADDAAGSNVGRFTYSTGKETITGNEEFFAFYPAEYCKPYAGNGYFYVEFPVTQYYKDVMGGKFPLPMYGVGTNRNVDFKYAGAVIKLQVWAEKELEAHSCVLSASNLYKKSFTYVKDEKWQSLSPAHDVENLKLSIDPHLKISTDANNPTEILMVIPLSSKRTLNNLKFSINCTGGGAELKKKSGLEVEPGTMVTFPKTKLNFETTRMYVDGFEGEFDVEWLKTAKDSVKVTMTSSAQLRETDFKQIMDATRSLHDPKHQIILDLSDTRAEKDAINGLDNNNVYVGFCGGSNRDNGIKNVSEFRLPQGITKINNRAFSYSDYTKVVVPASLTQIAGSPSNGCDKMVWEVAPGNNSFKSDDKGALYNFAMTTLMVLNGGSGSAYTILDGTTTIREWALYENSVIESLTIPASVTKLSQNCISGTPKLTTITCLGTTPAFIEEKKTDANRVGPKDAMKTLYVPKGCVEAYKNAWKVLLDEGNWEVKEIAN